MNRAEMRAQFQTLRELAQEPEAWLGSPVGADLAEDGRQVFLAVEAEAFDATLAVYQERYGNAPSIGDCLQALQAFCWEEARQGREALYRALAIGMTRLVLERERYGAFLQAATPVTNHTLALLLSPTYQAVSVQSYNEGLDVTRDRAGRPLDTFHPATYQGLFHELVHRLLFHDLYPRALGATLEEDISYFTHMEASVGCLDDLVTGEFLAVCPDLHVVTAGDRLSALYPEYGVFLRQALSGELTGANWHTLSLYRKRNMQLGIGDGAIPDNRVKQLILSTHKLTEGENALFEQPLWRYLGDQQEYAAWAQQMSRRNRVSAYREVIELLPPDARCLEKLGESFQTDGWAHPAALLSVRELPQLDELQRRRNQQVGYWRDLICRIAEMRGHLAEQTGDEEIYVLEELFWIAERVAAVIQKCKTSTVSATEHRELYRHVCEEIEQSLMRVMHHEERAHVRGVMAQVGLQLA